MQEYHKIQTVFLRDPATNFKTLLEGQWARPEFWYLRECNWVATEKIDGTNVRIKWDGERVTFGGKTDDAQMHTALLEMLSSQFTAELMGTVFDCPACIYGEGYGAKIQKSGGRYSATPTFAAFDVRVGDWWLEDNDVADVAKKCGVPSVPVVSRGRLHDLIALAQVGFKSRMSIDGGLDAEGLVMRPEVPLFNRKGERVIAKIKARDFAR